MTTTRVVHSRDSLSALLIFLAALGACASEGAPDVVPGDRTNNAGMPDADPASLAPGGGGMGGAPGMTPPPGSQQPDAGPTSPMTDALPQGLPPGDPTPQQAPDASPATNPATSPTCAGIVCGAGACTVESGTPQCDCPPHTVGAQCEACARGYTGRDCGTCVQGYVSDGAGGCMIDPCSASACQNGGKCVDSPASGPVCDCPPQFTGPNCERCASGHTGPTCTDCLPGYTRAGLTCLADVCAHVDCGVGGFCVDKSGTATCTCRTGYTGPKCDQCALGFTLSRGTCAQILPFTQASVLAWMDASATSTVDLDGNGDVTEWRSRPAVTTGRFWPLAPSGKTLPRYSPETRAVVFDGDQLASYSGVIGSTPHYTLFLVMRWNPAAGEQTIWRIIDTVEKVETGRIYAVGTKIVFEHQGTKDSVRDRVEADFGTSPSPMRLVIIKRAPFLNGTVNVVSDGTTQKSAVAMAAPFARPQLVGLGAYKASGDPVHLRGAFHEMALFGGGLDANEQRAVIDYLKVKWGL